MTKTFTKFIDCKCCGTRFATERGRKYCSNECKKKTINRNKSIRRDKRLSDNGVIDYSITLEKLHERDRGCCHLCGELTYFEDTYINDDGYLIHGNNYPSIDHVIAIANGGTHEWHNVKLAHRYCNSLKQNK